MNSVCRKKAIVGAVHNDPSKPVVIFTADRADISERWKKEIQVCRVIVASRNNIQNCVSRGIIQRHPALIHQDRSAIRRASNTAARYGRTCDRAAADRPPGDGPGFNVVGVEVRYVHLAGVDGSGPDVTTVDV